MPDIIDKILRRIAYALGFGKIYSQHPNRTALIMMAVGVAVMIMVILIVRAIRKKKRLNKAGDTEPHASGSEKQQAASGLQGAVPHKTPEQTINDMQASQRIEFSIAFDDSCDLNDLLEMIRELAALKDEGILTKDEFEQKKKEIVQKMKN